MSTMPSSLLSQLQWEELERRIGAQQRNREVHTPAISTFRWWARRSHALIGEILDQAERESDSDRFCVADPFSGGGTVAIEAARRGFDVFAQDLHPWSIAGIATTLEDVGANDLEASAERLLGRLSALRTELYGTCCPEHGEDAEVLTAFWVRHVPCAECGSEVHLYPYSLVTRASRLAEEADGWWGCRICGGVTLAPLVDDGASCVHCQAALPGPREALFPGRRLKCPWPRCGHDGPAPSAAPAWKMVLVQRSCKVAGRKHVHFGLPTESELVGAEKAASQSAPPRQLLASIPAGLETRVLRRNGLIRWADLYTPRQLRVLSETSAAIDSMALSAPVRNRLRLALCGCAEMAGYVSRWDRFYPKAFEALANHRFAVTGLSCETNLLAERGRGTLPRRLAHSVKAARWVEKEMTTDLAISRRRAGVGARRVKPGGIVLTEGSSEAQRAASGSVDLVLTDPPYFDDVQYAELAAVFLAWARATGLVASSAHLDLDSEAVVNSERSSGPERYRALLTAIFTETHRTLAQDGCMVLTFHNSDLRAWWGLGRALRDARFRIGALAVTRSENESDHAKRGSLAFGRDLVIECRPSSVQTAAGNEPELTSGATLPESRELLAAGQAIATIGEEESFVTFKTRFCELRGDITPCRISPRPASQANTTSEGSTQRKV